LNLDRYAKDYRVDAKHRRTPAQGRRLSCGLVDLALSMRTLARKQISVPRRLITLLCAVALAAPATARAENGITVFGGWRASGTLEDSVAQRDIRFRDSAAWSAAFDITYDAWRQFEFFGSYQSTSLSVTPIGSTTSMKLPVKITYFHFGGTNYFDGLVGDGPYVAGGLGFTRLTPSTEGFDSETKPSLSLALGYSLALGRYAALRLEGRGYWTLINSTGNLFCSGGCVVTIKGDTLSQFEMLLGVSARF
jgi:hypothetical protein